MADDLAATPDDRTFKPGGALDKIQQLALKWEAKAKEAQRSRRAHRLERAAWFVAGALWACGVWYLRHR